MSAFFYEFFLGTFPLFVWLLSFHSTIISYLLFVIYFTILLFIFLCSILLLFSTLTKILCTHCSTNKSGDICRFPPHDTTQESMAALLIWHLLLLVPPSYPRPIRSIRSVHPIQTAASEFLPFYHLLHKNKRANRYHNWYPSRLTSRVNGVNPNP